MEGEEEKGAPYLHGLDGLVGVLYGADLIVDALVRQQQLVEDLQGAGPVADRFQRHDRSPRCEERAEFETRRTGCGRAGARARTRSLNRSLSLHTFSSHTHPPPPPHTNPLCVRRTHTL